MPIRRYENLDLLISRRSDGYAASVIHSLAGETSTAHAFHLPFSQRQLTHIPALVGGHIRQLRLAPPSGEGAEESDLLDLQTFGARLFQVVFADQVGMLLQRSLALVEPPGGGPQAVGLRIRLRLTETPELAALPWEYLYDPDNQRFFVLSEATPLVRYLHVPQVEVPLQVELPLRILVVVADPGDRTPRLDVKEEWSRLRRAVAGLQKTHKVVLERLKRATLAHLQSRLRQSEPVHILHFIGHGFYDESAQAGGLVMEDAAKRSHLVSAEQLSVLLNDAAALRLVFLNACDGARGERSEPFSGTAQSLVQQGIPAVIAMQFAVSDQAAIALAHEFYQALADNFPVDGALAAARKAIFVHGSALEWGTPVLFLRSPDGRLFGGAEEPQNAPTSPLTESPPPLPSGVQINIATGGGKVTDSPISIGNVTVKQTH